MSTFREPISTKGAANRFREPVGELPEWITLWYTLDTLTHIVIRDGSPELERDSIVLLPGEAEALLEVLLDICPNAKALAHNWLLEEQKREYMEGGKL